MSGVLTNRLGRRYSPTAVVVSSVKYSTISVFEFRQVKYVYDCENPDFARYRMGAGRVNASERKIASGANAWTRATNHSQKPNVLVCGLSTRKMRTPRSIQKRATSSRAFHSAGQSSFSKSSG